VVVAGELGLGCALETQLGLWEVCRWLSGFAHKALPCVLIP
jgi:hypothetical protein